jgi:hypothetical protein
MRAGAEFFTEPSGSAQRRYEAMRAYFVDEQPAARVADQFGYSTASVHQMATLLRSGRMRLFADPRPGPKGPVKATGPLREKVMSLRARQLSVTEIARILTAGGTPVSAQTVWKICAAEGLPRLRGDNDAAARGPATQLAPVRAAALPGWPAGPADIPCDHAGLLLLAPAMTELHLHELITGCGYPATSKLSAWHSVATLLLAACARVPRPHHIDRITDDAGLAFFLGLTALPKATHLSTYSYRARRESSKQLLTGLIRRLRPLGLASGEEGFNCDFHAIRHHGDDPVLEEHYVPARSQRTRSVLTFFANDHASNEMVYANADITKTEQAAEIIAFADYWRGATGADPGLLVFDSQLTTYKMLEELSGRSITWLTLRQRGKAELARLAALPASAWKHHTIERAGRYRHPQLHDDLVTLKGISAPVRQIAIKNIGRDQPTLLITNGHDTPAKDLFARYAERMLIENELDAYISGFSLNALSSSVSLNVDLDTTLTVVAGNLYRLFARNLPRYSRATPDTIWRHFLDDTGTLHITPEAVTVDLTLRSHHPVLIDSGFADLQVPIPWWDNRPLSFRFPPR